MEVKPVMQIPQKYLTKKSILMPFVGKIHEAANKKTWPALTEADLKQHTLSISDFILCT